MKVKVASAAEVGIRSNGGTIDRSSLVKDLSKSISVARICERLIKQVIIHLIVVTAHG